MTPNEKYFPSNRENLLEPIKMKLSEKLKNFSQIFTAFLESSFNFKYFEKKDESHSLCVSKIIDCEICAYGNV